jgi:hypothetical protein
MLHLFENPIGKSEHDVVYEQLTLMRAAEDYGFDSVWPAEHHFSEYGYCASPALTLAALALETKRLRLGTGVVVLPLNHPLRVAEGGTARARSGRRPGRCRDSAWGIEDPECRPSRPRRGRSLRSVMRRNSSAATAIHNVSPRRELEVAGDRPSLRRRVGDEKVQAQGRGRSWVSQCRD